MSKLHPIAERIRKPGPKRILALDGGGIRGALTLGYLEKIEDILREQHNDPDLLLCDYFDLIGGTSTGAIIAAGLAKGMKAIEIKELYQDLGGKIFGSTYWNIAGYGYNIFKGAKYKHKNLEDELNKTFGNMKLGDTAEEDKEGFKTGFCVITKRVDTSSTWILSNNPFAKYYEQNKNILVRDLLRASSAAPSYFHPHIFDVNGGVKEQQNGAFVDGGVSLANNPALSLFLLSQLKGYRMEWKVGEEELMIISLGTGTTKTKRDYKDYAKRGLIKWGKEVPNLFMNDATWFNQAILQTLSDSPTAKVIDREIGDLKEDLFTGKPLFTYQRFNQELDRKSLEKIGIDISDAILKNIGEMDFAKNRAKLAKIGAASANEYIKNDHFPEVFRLDYQKKEIKTFKNGDIPDLPFEEAIKKPIAIKVHQMNEDFVVETLEGTMRGKAGDYLMVGVNGEMYPCAKEIFEKTYDKQTNT